MSEIRVPDLGENIDEAAVLRVLVRAGERVEPDQPILELESDKASFELPSPEAGVVRRVLVHAGDTVKVGQVALELDGGAVEAKPHPEARAGARPPNLAPPAEPMPSRPAAPEPAAPKPLAEPRKAEAREPVVAPVPAIAAREPAPSEPPPPEPLAPIEIVEPRLREVQAPRTEPPRALAPEPTPTPPATELAQLSVGPATRRFARQLGVDLVEVARRANTQHVTREHILAYLHEHVGPARDERVGMERVRRLGAERLAAAWREVPHVTHHELADITELERARRALRAEEPDTRLTITALAVKVCAIALRSHPRLNSSLDLERGEIVVHRAHHIGVAVDTEHGLLVPVVRDAAHKTTRQLAAEIAALATRARDRKLSPADLAGATFSITNLGGISGTSFTPIVVPPQVAILGLSRARPAQLPEAGAPAERIWLPLSLSYDHRVVDGAEAARFVAALVRLFQAPIRLVLEG